MSRKDAVLLASRTLALLLPPEREEIAARSGSARTTKENDIR
jgi:hypothetical protein